MAEPHATGGFRRGRGFHGQENRQIIEHEEAMAAQEAIGLADYHAFEGALACHIARSYGVGVDDGGIAFEEASLRFDGEGELARGIGEGRELDDTFREDGDEAVRLLHGAAKVSVVKGQAGIIFPVSQAHGPRGSHRYSGLV